MSRRKQRAVRLLELAVRKAVESVNSGVSVNPESRSAAQLQKYVRKLKGLASNDPDYLFWPTLQKAILRTLRYIEKFEK